MPGYAYGEIPPVPLFTVPDLGTLTADRGAFPTSLTTSLTSVPGVTVGPARCDSAGVITSGSSTTVFGGEGSGTYHDSSKTIVNYGNGAGTYTAPGITIVNYGDGTGTVNGVTGIKMAPLAQVGAVGPLPDMEDFSPVESCGTVISLDSSLLFDFDSYQLRPEAQDVLSNLTTVLNEAQVPQASVVGHTDSIADDAYNQTLSEQRAQAVVDQLKSTGATTTLTATGYGETKPVAPNTNADGSDNPAGRQLNRRVEILVPRF